MTKELTDDEIERLKALNFSGHEQLEIMETEIRRRFSNINKIFLEIDKIIQDGLCEEEE